MAWTTDPDAPACTARTPAPKAFQARWRHPDAEVLTISDGPTGDDPPSPRIRVRRCPHCLGEERVG